MLAVLAVSDKDGVEELADGLLALGWDVVATDGTRRRLSAPGRRIGAMSDLAGVPTLLGGRVKTLTVSVMAGVLGRDTEEDRRELAEHRVRRIDLVCCNYYLLPDLPDLPDLPGPDDRLPVERFRERIDVGGPAMLRGAAKNWEHVIPLTDPRDYPGVLELLRASGGRPDGVGPRERLALAHKAFRVSAEYDRRIAALFDAALVPDAR